MRLFLEIFRNSISYDLQNQLIKLAPSFMNRLPELNHLNLLEILSVCFYAGEEILEVYKTDFEVEQKEDHSPVTLADKRSHQVITEYLSEKFPNVPVVSEESENLQAIERNNIPSIWLLDPLDGTKEFVKKRKEFTINLGLTREDQPVFGVVYAPALGHIYLGALGAGAYKIDLESAKLSKLQCSTFSKSDLGLRFVASISHPSKETEDYIQQFKDPKVSNYGSSIKLLAVAEGLADIYPRFVPTWEWDTCAAHIILNEAGGACIQANSKTPLIYNKSDLRNPFFICHGHEKK